jgi:hypothetical protein
VRLIVGLVDNRAYNGDRERNPFNFQHFSLTEIGIYLDGQLYGLKPLKPDFSAGQYIAAYSGLFGGTNKINRDEGNNISRSDYASGYALFVYDLTPDLAENDYMNLTRQGTVRLGLKFRYRSGANRHRRRVRGIPERDRNRSKSQHRFRFQQVIDEHEGDRTLRSQ